MSDRYLFLTAGSLDPGLLKLEPNPGAARVPDHPAARSGVARFPEGRETGTQEAGYPGRGLGPGGGAGSIFPRSGPGAVWLAGARAARPRLFPGEGIHFIPLRVNTGVKTWL